MSNKDDDSKNEPVPPGMGAMHSLAVGYGQYVSYLKSGGQSGISSVFGKVSLDEKGELLSAAGARLSEAGERLEKMSRQLREENSGANGNQFAEPAGGPMSAEDKLGAVFGILSGALTVEDVCRTYGVAEARVRSWLETACRGMEAALREDRS